MAFKPPLCLHLTPGSTLTITLTQSTHHSVGTVPQEWKSANVSHEESWSSFFLRQAPCNNVEFTCLNFQSFQEIFLVHEKQSEYTSCWKQLEKGTKKCADLQDAPPWKRLPTLKWTILSLLHIISTMHIHLLQWPAHYNLEFKWKWTWNRLGMEQDIAREMNTCCHQYLYGMWKWNADTAATRIRISLLIQFKLRTSEMWKIPMLRSLISQQASCCDALFSKHHSYQTSISRVLFHFTWRIVTVTTKPDMNRPHHKV